jgi:YHS domain-containing protein
MWLTKFLLAVAVFLLVARSIRGLIGGIAEGMGGGRSRTGSPERGVRMVRDPVCGTFVIPADAVAVRDADGLHHFCSDKCRKTFLARAGRSR